MQSYSSDKKKTGILLVNLGTPEKPTKKHVKKYLREFLSDRRVIEANSFIWYFILRFIVLPLRCKRVAGLYRSIWREKEGVSPLLYYTARQAEALQGVVDHDLYTVEYAMTYGHPSIQQALNNFAEKQIKVIKILPLYPQYSATTTAAVYDKVFRVLSRQRWQPTIQGIEPYYAHSNYIFALKNSLKSHIDRLDYLPDVVVVSFHGLPVEYFEKGDPYYCHCHKTFRLLKEAISKSCNIDIVLSFQSRFGPKKWLQPYTSEILLQLARENKSVVVMAPGFSSDCLETLEELNVTEREAFVSSGGQNYSVVPCLNDSMEHIDLLKSLVAEGMTKND